MSLQSFDGLCEECEYVDVRTGQAIGGIKTFIDDIASIKRQDVMILVHIAACLAPCGFVARARVQSLTTAHCAVDSFNNGWYALRDPAGLIFVDVEEAVDGALSLRFFHHAKEQ